jgi:rare lipoprotein A (peptidoglycan hydrolase)
MKLQVCYQVRATVRVNDWGPYTGGRGMKFPQGAAEAIGLTAVGVDYVDAPALEPSSH